MFRYLDLYLNMLISNNKMQTFKGRLDSIFESTTHSEDMVDDLFMVSGNMLRILITYLSSYCLYLKYNYICNPVDINNISISISYAFIDNYAKVIYILRFVGNI